MGSLMGRFLRIYGQIDSMVQERSFMSWAIGLGLELGPRPLAKQ